MAREVLRLPYRPPLHGAALRDFLARRAVPGVEELADGVYRRTFRAGRIAGWVELRIDPRHHVVELIGSPAAPEVVVAAARRLFDLDADPAAVAAVVGSDPALAPLVAAAPGLRVPGAWDGFELAVRAVLGQQVSVSAARTLLGRLVALAGSEQLAGSGRGGSLPSDATSPPAALTRLFPDAEEVAAADLDRLGVPASRRRTLRSLAEAVADGRLALTPGADPVEVGRRLQELPGIGPWTAAYVSLRALGDQDALLVGDLALAKAAARRGLPERWPELIAHAERWRPWRGYACLWLWAA